MSEYAPKPPYSAVDEYIYDADGHGFAETFRGERYAKAKLLADALNFYMAHRAAAYSRGGVMADLLSTQLISARALIVLYADERIELLLQKYEGGISEEKETRLDFLTRQLRLLSPRVTDDDRAIARALEMEKQG